MKQQLEQLLKDAEEVTAKMREALASMDNPAINMEHGKWYRVNSGHDWLIKFDRWEDKKIMVLDSFCISTDSNYGGGYHCDINHIKSYSPATPEDMQLLPDGHPEKPKPALAATYGEVVDEVKPLWSCSRAGGIFKTYTNPYSLPTEAAAKQARAFIEIKNWEAYCAAKFEGERDCCVDIHADGSLISMEYKYGIIKVTREAAEWLIANHPEPFLVFFGVKS